VNREYDKSAFRKSDGKLFQTLVAAAAKVLSPKTAGCSVDNKCPRASASVGVQLAITGKVFRGMTGEGQIDERRCLEHNTLP